MADPVFNKCEAVDLIFKKKTSFLHKNKGKRKKKERMEGGSRERRNEKVKPSKRHKIQLAYQVHIGA